MLDILYDYLTQATTPELTQALVHAHALFATLEVEDFQDGFEDLLMVADNTDPGDTVTQIVQLTNQYQADILRAHDVLLTPDQAVPTSIYNTFIQGLVDLQNYEDVGQLSRLTLLDTSSEEVFAEVIALVSHQSADELLPYLEQVGQALILRLREYAYTPAITLLEASVPGERQRYLDALNAYCDMVGTRDFFIVVKLQSGMQPGYPFDVYLTHDLEQLEEKTLADELIATAFVSRDGFDNPRSVIKANLERLVFDLDQLTRVDILINQRLVEFAKHARP